MDFDVLLKEITELENSNREVERKRLDEIQRHEATKKELKKAKDELVIQREKEIALLEKITAIQTEKDNEIKASKQLKETVRQLKQSNVALKEQAEKEVIIAKEERKQLCNTLEFVNSKYREMKALYLKVGVQIMDTESQPTSDLMTELELLKKQLADKEQKVKDTVTEFESLNRYTTQLQEQFNELKLYYDAFEEWRESSSCISCSKAIEDGFKLLDNKTDNKNG